MLAPWKKSYNQPRQHIKKQKHYFADKGPCSQSYGFSSSHVWMWELNHKESWVPKNWCFWTVVLEKTLENPLDCKEIQPVHPKGNESWIFIGRTDAEAETPIPWPPDAKNWLTRKDTDAEKDRRQEKKETTEDEMVAWHHQLDGHEFEQAPGVGDGQGSLACCSPQGRKVRCDWATELSWTELNISYKLTLVVQTVKNPRAMRETWVRSLGWEDPLKEGTATHSSILVWRIPMDRGAWWATTQRVAKSQTWLK